MSWFEFTRHGRFAGLAVVIVIAGALTAACGFTPVYQQGTSSSVREYLNLIDVAPISGLSGLQVRNRLSEKISPNGTVDEARFRLSVKLNSSTDAVLIQLDNTATRQNLKMNASFTLTDLTTGKAVFEGHAISIGSYNVIESEFASIAAENNATERAAREIGEEIFDLLVVYFNRAKS